MHHNQNLTLLLHAGHTLRSTLSDGSPLNVTFEGAGDI